MVNLTFASKIYPDNMKIHHDQVGSNLGMHSWFNI